MIDHVSVAVHNLATSAAVYERVLAPLGLTRLVDRPNTVGFGKAYTELWLNARPGVTPLSAGTGIHICLRAREESDVRAFHEAAMAAGWRDAGAPGPRQAAMTVYYAAFIQDPDGNKLEAACFPRRT